MLLSSIFIILSVIEALSAVHAGCGYSRFPPSEFRVVGGTKANHGSWPWQVSLRLRVSGSNHVHVCGGSVISDRWILTAAHCFLQTANLPSYYEPQYYVVRVGEHRQDRYDGTEKDHSVVKIVKHHQYRGRMPQDPHDIALMQLSSPIRFNNHVQPVCLNRNMGEFDGRPDCWITGWGETVGTGDKNHLQQLQGNILSNDQCNSGWDRNTGWHGTVQTGMTCFGLGHKGACVGDSGGPLVCKKSGTQQYYQVGVTSWGHGSCTAYGKPSVYTRVASYGNWITSVVNSGG